MTARSLLSNSLFILLLRLVVGIVFIVASIEKAADPAAFAVSIGHYKLIPETPALVVATILPWVELLVGFALLFGAGLRGSSFLATLMLFVFTAAVASALVRGLDISCGCFTQDPSAGIIGWRKILENTLLLLAAALTYFSHTGDSSIIPPMAQRPPGSP